MSCRESKLGVSESESEQEKEKETKENATTNN
jgi:hypothetical protein